MQLLLLSILAVAPSTVLGDGVKFTSPAGGATFAAGASFDVEWADDGGSPDLSQLGTIAAIQIYFGGKNIGNDAVAVGACTTAADQEVSVKTIQCNAPAGASAQSVTNGFFLGMTSNIVDGGTIINFSSRFSVTGLIGTNAPTTAAVTAAGAIAGVDDVPAEINSASNNAAASGTVAEGVFGTPYQSQTGLTKYAPMQPIPPTKITAKGYSRLYPTSKFSIASNWMPPPSILTTITASQTSTVQSIENTVAPVPGPSASRDADMAKYLARWKD
ncbi:hypothetical protein K431DRAFT_280706 [Polychaeton citri CBS 116435]|uniref:Yeast cell wall synthesis Kre9/Knh1 C-terminal domain-containing protein n=1 Tax=Polychaeton citri CBS 116435 TaxID=1314669 RepID=A0A9P4QJN1_9PEZI|nr:hypothetical protein K431DRAFT_280706 [Polychaeton citri CBS 116435]